MDKRQDAMRCPYGYGMVEILITILVVSLGLLGIAALFTRAGKVADESYARHEALAIARQLAERMASNRTETNLADVSNYLTTSAGAPDFSQPAYKDCANASCTSREIAAYDLVAFHNLLIGASKTSGGAAAADLTAARGCVQFLGDKTLADLTDPPRFRITVAWQGREASSSSIIAANSCASGLYSDENLRRLVSLEVPAT